MEFIYVFNGKYDGYKKYAAYLYDFILKLKKQYKVDDYGMLDIFKEDKTIYWFLNQIEFDFNCLN